MAKEREELMRKAAARGKYAPLYRHLLRLWPETEWRADFAGVEQVRDANIVATMLAYGERRLLTFNIRDFRRFAAHIEIVDPAAAA